MRLFDTHTHINDERFDNDRDQMIQDCFDQGVEYIMCPAVDRKTAESAIALAEQYNDKVRAIGEIGLDYYYDFSDRDVQAESFKRQLAIAREVDLPIIIHDRDAHGAIRDMLVEHGKGNYGVFHCFSTSLEMAKEFIKMGYYISFAGPVVFPKSTNLKEVAKHIPLDRLLIETDSPYLTPPPFRGRRNDPSKTQFVAQEIAQLRGMDVEELAAIALENGKRCFGIE